MKTKVYLRQKIKGSHFIGDYDLPGIPPIDSIWIYNGQRLKIFKTEYDLDKEEVRVYIHEWGEKVGIDEPMNSNVPFGGVI